MSVRSRHTGVTLPELLIVVTLIALLGTFAGPSLSSAESLTLDTATAEVTAALRFARDESTRTGSIHSVRILRLTNQVRVLLVTDFAAPNLLRPLARHPITRQLYVIGLGDNPATRSSQINAVSIGYDTVGPQTRVDFMPTGQPVYVDAFDQPHLMNTGSIVLSTQSTQQTIVIDPLTGRITSS